MKILARLLSFWIPIPKLRQKARNVLEYVFLCSPFFNIDTINTHLKAKKIGKNLKKLSIWHDSDIFSVYNVLANRKRDSLI